MAHNKTAITFSLALLALAILFGSASAQVINFPTQVTNPLGSLSSWLPIVSIAIFISIAIGFFLYIIGKLLNDGQISSRGITELGQSIGTAIYVVLIISVLILFGSFVSNSSLVGTSTGDFGSHVTNMCGDLQNSQVSLLQGDPTSFVCALVENSQNSGGSASSYVNYGLASSYVMIANLTNQAAANLNGLYVYEGMIGFLSTLKSDPGLCLPSACADPLVPRLLSIDLASQPFAGYSLITFMTKPLETQGIFIMYMFLTQLVIMFILLVVWPFLLAAGIILRAISFTRSAGGLLMGITLVIVIILPLVMIIEYNMLGSGVTTSQLVGAPIPPQATWNWNDNSATSSGMSATHTFLPGPQTITLDVQSNGQSGSASANLDVIPGAAISQTAQSAKGALLPVSFEVNVDQYGVATVQVTQVGNEQQLPGIYLHGLPTTGLIVTPQGSVDNQNTGNPKTTITWDWGDGKTSTGWPQGLSHTYASASNPTIKLTVTDDKGNMNSVSQAVAVGLNPITTDTQTSSSDNIQINLAFATGGAWGPEKSPCDPNVSPDCRDIIYNSLTPNFYVFPSISAIANYNGCWPLAGNLPAEEAKDSVLMAISLGFGAAFTFGGFVSQVPQLTGILSTPCVPSAAVATSMEFMDVYGLMSVAGFVIPFLNILIILSAMKNVSFLFGGDTDIAGLGKLV